MSGVSISGGMSFGGSSTPALAPISLFYQVSTVTSTPNSAGTFFKLTELDISTVYNPSAT